MKTTDTSRRPAFTLLELLAVIAVMSVLMVISVPAVGSLARGSEMNQALGELSGCLDQARQYAISHNTYVWVALRPEAGGVSGEELSVAILASKTGADSSHWSAYGVVPDAQIDVVSRPRTFRGIRFAAAGAFGADRIPGLAGKPPVTSANGPGTQASFRIRLGGAPAGVDFSRVIQFTPSGAARVSSSVIDIIELGLQPMRGGAADGSNVAVLRVNGLTGQTAIYRP